MKHETKTRILKYLPVFLIATMAISVRRPDQIIFPEVWNEDGIFIIPSLIERGIWAVFEPVNGYLIIPSRLLTYIALSISFEHYPVISTVLGVLVQAACVTVVAAAPTKLPSKPLCALALLFLPINPEVYALPQYTFWWTTLFLFLAMMWVPGQFQIWRAVFIIIGGFSSPLGIILTPVFGIKYIVSRSSEDAVAMGVSISVSLVQLYLVFVGDPIQTSIPSIWQIPLILERFFGYSTIASGTSFAMPIGTAIALLLATATFALKPENRMPYILLGLCLGASIGSSALRVPLEVISPTGNGPRYFFLPQVVMSWMLIWIATKAHIGWRLGALATMLFAAPLSYSAFQRHQQSLEPWAERARVCLVNDITILPVHHDGNQAHAHGVPYHRASCEKAHARALLD